LLPVGLLHIYGKHDVELMVWQSSIVASAFDARYSKPTPTLTIRPLSCESFPVIGRTVSKSDSV
jgi:hypothetical protein